MTSEEHNDAGELDRADHQRDEAKDRQLLHGSGNRIAFSTDYRFVQLWNQGTPIQWFPISQGGLHVAVDRARKYIRDWAGDETPDIDRDVTDKMRAADANLQRMAFGKEHR